MSSTATHRFWHKSTDFTKNELSMSEWDRAKQWSSCCIHAQSWGCPSQMRKIMLPSSVQQWTQVSTYVLTGAFLKIILYIIYYLYIEREYILYICIEYEASSYSPVFALWWLHPCLCPTASILRCCVLPRKTESPQYTIPSSQNIWNNLDYFGSAVCLLFYLQCFRYPKVYWVFKEIRIFKCPQNNVTLDLPFSRY